MSRHFKYSVYSPPSSEFSFGGDCERVSVFSAFSGRNCMRELFEVDMFTNSLLRRCFNHTGGRGFPNREREIINIRLHMGLKNLYSPEVKIPLKRDI